MKQSQHYSKLEKEALRAAMQPLADLWKERRESAEATESKRRVIAHNSALLRDYKNYNADLIEQAQKQAIKREIIGLITLGALGAFIGYLITAAF